MEYLDQIKAAIKTSRNALLNLSEIEIKVLDATTNEPWGPTSTEMREIARASHSYHNFPLIMNVIWKRLADDYKWRHVYKGLVLLEYLIKLGSEQVIREARAHIMEIQMLCEYRCPEEESTDVGASVREKARNVSDLLHDEERIKKEREKARQSISKYMSYESSESRGYMANYDDFNKPSSSFSSSSSSSSGLRSSTSNSPGAMRAETSKAAEQPKKPVATGDLLNIDFITSTPSPSPSPSFNIDFSLHPPSTSSSSTSTPSSSSASTIKGPPQFPSILPYETHTRSSSAPILQPTSAKPEVEWAEFEEAKESGKTVTTDPNDPWAHKNLFDFGELNKGSSQKTKTPIGALTGAAVRPQMAPMTIYPNPNPNPYSIPYSLPISNPNPNLNTNPYSLPNPNSNLNTNPSPLLNPILQPSYSGSGSSVPSSNWASGFANSQSR